MERRGPFRSANSLLGAGLLLREELKRIEELAVGEHLVVQMIAGRPAGVADVPDNVAALYLGALLDAVVEQMAVACLEAEAVVEDDQVAIAALETGVRHGARSGGVDRLSALAGDVEPGVEIITAR